MKRIEYLSEAKEDEFLFLIEQITQKLQQDMRATEAVVVDTIIDILAFKYWQENRSLEVNEVLECSDYDYVQLHWKMFCESAIGKSLGYPEFYRLNEVLSTNLSKQIATSLEQLSEYVTHRHYDFINAEVIERWLERHQDAVINGGLDQKAVALVKVYSRGKEDLNASAAEREEGVA